MKGIFDLYKKYFKKMLYFIINKFFYKFIKKFENYLIDIKEIIYSTKFFLLKKLDK